VEAPTLITYIVAGCYEVSQVLGEVARAWIGDALSDPPVVRTDREIADLLNLKQGVVSALLEDCKSVAVAVCADKYDIDSPFV
jgi:hypothetical protein